MRFLVALSLFLVCTAVEAAHLDYLGSRKWVEQQCAADTTPQDQRLFVGRFARPKWARILRFHHGITLREIIDGTPLKGKALRVCVMRLDSTNIGPFTRREFISVKPSEKPDYEIKRLDVIWLYDDGPIVET